ncbi:hypothetical protein [Terasakiella sp. SH-1]|uniref:hypothetical protein n=1 Tax=Terasakiella sp. SH-1 TaxID=2560057 RepID=UPI0010736EDA|nr:hypothetical protein [Terasakiella sp. SH-1]
MVIGKGIDRYRGQKEWIISFIFFGLSFSSLFLRLYDLYLLSVISGHFCQFIGYYMLGLGCLRYLGHNYRGHWVMGVFLAGYLGLILLLGQEAEFLNVRLAIVYFVAATFSFAISQFIAFFKQERTRSENLFMYIYRFHGIFSAVKGLLSLTDTGRETLFSKTTLAQTSYLEYIFLLISMVILLNLMGKNAEEKI